MTPIIFDTICASYERQINAQELVIATLRHDLADAQELLSKLQELNDKQSDLIKRQGETLENLLRQTTDVRDGCLDLESRFERGEMQGFYIE